MTDAPGPETIDWSTSDQSTSKKLRHTGEGRCPSQIWFPAFPTEQVRGLKAHRKTQEETPD